MCNRQTIVERQSIASRRACYRSWPVRANSEIRQVFEAGDFGAELSPELREAEERMREQYAKS